MRARKHCVFERLLAAAGVTKEGLTRRELQQHRSNAWRQTVAETVAQKVVGRTPMRRHGVRGQGAMTMQRLGGPAMAMSLPMITGSCEVQYG